MELPNIEDQKKYWNETLLKRTERNARHERVFMGLDRLNLTSGRTALDLGCGVGHTSIYMARQGVKVVAIDYAEKLIQYARTNNSNKNVNYLVADATNFEIDKKFDMITIIDLMEHIEPNKIPDFLETVNKHAHSRSLVYLNIPVNYFSEFGRDKFNRHIIENEIPLHIVLHLFDGAGFMPMSVETFGLSSPIEYYECIFVTKQHAFDVWEEIYVNKSSVPFYEEEEE